MMRRVLLGAAVGWCAGAISMILWRAHLDDLAADAQSIRDSEAADPAERIPWDQAKTVLGLDPRYAGQSFSCDCGRTTATLAIGRQPCCGSDA